MSYRWSDGEWARYYGENRVRKLSAMDIRRGYFFEGGSMVQLSECTPVTVVAKPQPKRIKRSELRAWFERQHRPDMNTQWDCAGNLTAYEVYCVAADDWARGKTFEKAILALRAALRKAGKFTP